MCGVGGKSADVVSLFLVPIERLDGANSAVAGSGIGSAIVGVCATSVYWSMHIQVNELVNRPASQTWLADGSTSGVAGDLALEAGHVHCVESA